MGRTWLLGSCAVCPVFLGLPLGSICSQISFCIDQSCAAFTLVASRESGPQSSFKSVLATSISQVFKQVIPSRVLWATPPTPPALQPWQPAYSPPRTPSSYLRQLLIRRLHARLFFTWGYPPRVCLEQMRKCTSATIESCRTGARFHGAHCRQPQRCHKAPFFYSGACQDDALRGALSY